MTVRTDAARACLCDWSQPDREANEVAAERMSSGPVPTGAQVGRIDSCRFAPNSPKPSLAIPGESIEWHKGPKRPSSVVVRRDMGRSEEHTSELQSPLNL